MSTFARKVVWQIEDEIGVYTVLERDEFDYDGPVAECKKGRETQQKISQAQLDEMTQQAAQQKVEQQAADKTLGTWETQGKPGQLSPAAAAQLASDNDNITRAYNGMRRTAYANAGTRGFGSAPSGFARTTENGIDLGQQQSETSAFRRAQENTQNLQQAAVNARMGLSGQNLSGENAAANTASSSALAQSKMGSTLGDIGEGISTAAGLIGPVSGVAKAFGKLGTYSGTNNPEAVG